MLRPLQMMCASAPLAKINSRLFGILHMEVYWWPFASYYFPTHQPTPPKRTGKPKCGRHRERLYLCTVPTNKFLCDPHTEKNLKKTGRRVFFTGSATYSQGHFTWIRVCDGQFRRQGGWVCHMTKLLVVHLPPFHLRRNQEKEGNRWAL